MCVHVCVYGTHCRGCSVFSCVPLSTRLLPEALSKHYLEDICDTPLPLDSQSKALQDKVI